MILKDVKDVSVRKMYAICQCGGIKPGHKNMDFDNCKFVWTESEKEDIWVLIGSDYDKYDTEDMETVDETFNMMEESVTRVYIDGYLN